MKTKRFAGVIFVNSENKVLLQQRTEDAPYYPNYWSLPGGKVEGQETVEHALEREIREELGVELVNYALFQKSSQRESDSIVERYIFWSNFDQNIENLRLGESSALQYFSEDEIASLKIAFNLKKVIKQFLKNYKRKNFS